jgi:hypothetical protein
MIAKQWFYVKSWILSSVFNFASLHPSNNNLTLWRAVHTQLLWVPFSPATTLYLSHKFTNSEDPTTEKMWLIQAYSDRLFNKISLEFFHTPSFNCQNYADTHYNLTSQQSKLLMGLDFFKALYLVMSELHISIAAVQLHISYRWRHMEILFSTYPTPWRVTTVTLTLLLTISWSF